MWDEGRRLEEVRVGNTVEAEFLYAIDDRRVRRIADGVATYYLADGSEYTIDGTDSYFTYFHSVNGRMVAFTKSDTEVTTWMGADIVNSTSNTRDENGVTAQQRYTPFGEVRIDGNLATDHTYTGQVNDETTGLAFYNARYYDPAPARFITPDSIVPNPNDGQDYNRYTYVRNNPVRFGDPSGNMPCEYCNDRQTGVYNEAAATARDYGVPVSNTYSGIGGSSTATHSPPTYVHIEPQLAHPQSAVEPVRGYSLEYTIDVRVTASQIHDDITSNLSTSPFPFSSDCGLLVIGATCNLDGGLLGPQPVQVVDIGEASFSFESLPGHAEGAGNNITFTFENSVEGALILSVDAVGPYDTFLTRWVPGFWFLNENLLVPSIWGGQNSPVDGFAERIEENYR